MKKLFKKDEMLWAKNDVIINVKNNENIDMENVDTMVEKESEMGGEQDVKTVWEMEVDEVRKSDFTIVFDDFCSCGMSFSKGFDYETIELLGKVYYKGEMVDSFGCLYCDATGKSAMADEDGCVSYILVDRDLVEKVMCQYMAAVLAKVYGARSDYRPESRMSKVFEGLHCAVCREEDYSFMVYADDVNEIDTMDMEKAKSKRFIDDDLLGGLIYISDDEKCDKVRLYF